MDFFNMDPLKLQTDFISLARQSQPHQKSQETSRDSLSAAVELRKTCSEFEVILLQQFLKEARLTESMLGEASNQLYGDMILESLAKAIAQKGVGFGEMLFEQLNKEATASEGLRDRSLNTQHNLRRLSPEGQ
ncbi:MAG: hypothetical protein ABH878_07050 [bacterium]